MSLSLNELQKKLCSALQEGLPISARPFAELAAALDSDEETVLREIRLLKESGVIRRIRAVTNYRALGFAGTLVAAHVPEGDVHSVADAVNSLRGVSHNYLRSHHYNMWFTLQAPSTEQIELTLADLGQRLGIDFHSLPVERVFKLDVRFDVEGKGQAAQGDAPKVPQDQVVQLNENEKRILSKLQKDLEPMQKPFDFLCTEAVDGPGALEIIAGLVHKGVIRRVGGVLDQRKLGFTTNVMFCCAVAPERIVEAGACLAASCMVSHCYQRKTFAGWPYNLFAMMHGRNMDEIQRVTDGFVETEGINSFELLATTGELKKQPVKHDLGDL
ncbi:MAG: siroheme decarboxylase subunit alpha [Planctomycetota bacterium]